MRVSIGFFTALFVVLALVVTGCGGSEEDPEISQEKEEEIVSVIEKNIEATEEEDLERVAKTMYSDHPDFELFMEETEQIFEQFDLSYELEILDVNIVDEETARVEFRQETSAENEENFEDNLITGTHELRKADGQWKIYETHITDSQPL